MMRSLLNRSPRTRLALRVMGALLVLFVGLDHYYEYSVQSYSVIPTIGTLFLLNFISATTVGLLLLAPVERLARRSGPLVVRAAAAGGFAIAASSLIALLVSEQTKLFGFMESNYRPAILVALGSEAAAAVVLALVAVSTLPTRTLSRAQGVGQRVRRADGKRRRQEAGRAGSTPTSCS